ncbi:MAG: NAD(P)/FAD-dependent oxidoreductase [Rhizobiales bacterium]|nr:NAD(P)/FAD-dependent oxidoreductase [Hyphomicrobiales bacterium]
MTKKGDLMDINHPIELYDALIIGGGPAGITAAVYLARACRSVVVFDCPRPGRSDWGQTNHNYLGFPKGISIDDLTARGRQQAEHFSAHFHEEEVASLTEEDGVFAACTPDGTLHGRAVILATGVNDRWVQFPGYEEYIGRSMHWCIVCDGYEMQGQRVLVAGNDESAAELAMQLQRFTEQVTMVTNSGALGLPQATVRALDAQGIRLVVGRIVEARAKKRGYFEAVLLNGGGEIALDHLFSAQSADPNTDLARSLGVELTSTGYIKVDTETKTSVPGVYAAGEVTRLFSHQVVTAAHEGATAATALDHGLYQQDQAALRAGRT